jgi:lysophospholipase L1-like esterase
MKTGLRRLAGGVGYALFLLACAELTVRAFFAMSQGRRVFAYGSPWYRVELRIPVRENAADLHGYASEGFKGYSSERDVGYSKYFPNEVRYTPSPDGLTFYATHINNHGFRGPDFTIEKPPGVFRVVTLGASSTFGFHDRDDETYPYYLSNQLRAYGRGQFEVINLGIPHLTSGNILALFRAEGLLLHPDVVTFYEGINDAGIVETPDAMSGRLWMWLRAHLLLAELADQLGNGGAVETAQAREAFAARRSQAFLANLEALADECRQHGIRLLVATQQAKSEMIPPAELHGVTYQREVDLIRARLASDEGVKSDQRVGPRDPVKDVLAHMSPVRRLLIHAHLMDDLRAWAPAHGVELVDVQRALDGRRDLLLSYVHLDRRANRIVANVFAQQILAGLPAETAKR